MAKQRTPQVEEAKVEATVETKVEQVAPVKEVVEAPVTERPSPTPTSVRPNGIGEDGLAVIKSVNDIFATLSSKQSDPRLDRAYKNALAKKDAFVSSLQTYFLIGGK